MAQALPRIWRRAMARHQRWYWPTVVVIAGLSAFGLQQRAANLQRERDALGSMVVVWIADEPLQPGDRIDDHVNETLVPAAFAPPTAWAEPSGVARQHVDVGTVLTEADVVTGAGPLDLVPDGWVVLAATENLESGAQVGDQVGIISAGMRIVDVALVVGSTDDGTLLAVPADAAGLVAAAHENRSVTLVRLAQVDNAYR